MQKAELHAVYKGAELPVFTPIASSESRIYLDLCNDSWQVVEITPAGWKVISPSPVRFRRVPGMLALPRPSVNGSFKGLRAIMNLREEENWILAISWLLGTLHPKGPYPLLCIQGEQGSGKSTTAKMLRNLTDPSRPPLRSPSRNEQELMIGARNAHILAFDNLSPVKHAWSDQLARLATGNGFVARKLYADSDEIRINACRPVLLNGIEDLIGRPDLADRSIVIKLPRLVSRKMEEEVWEAFDKEHAKALGALLDASVEALRNKRSVKIEHAPRMADFAHWVVAAESKLPWTSGRFLECMDRQARDATSDLLANHILTPLIEQLANESWKDSPSELSNRLDAFMGSARKPLTWPAGPAGISGELTRLEPDLLRNLGIEVKRGRMGAKRWISFKRISKAAPEVAA